MQVVIPYNKLEAILGDYCIRYKGCIWTTEEDIKTFPDTLTLKNPMAIDEFKEMYIKFLTALEGGK